MCILINCSLHSPSLHLSFGTFETYSWSICLFKIAAKSCIRPQSTYPASVTWPTHSACLLFEKYNSRLQWDGGGGEREMYTKFAYCFTLSQARAWKQAGNNFNSFTGQYSKMFRGEFFQQPYFRLSIDLGIRIYLQINFISMNQINFNYFPLSMHLVFHILCMSLRLFRCKNLIFNKIMVTSKLMPYLVLVKPDWIWFKTWLNLMKANRTSLL